MITPFDNPDVVYPVKCDRCQRAATVNVSYPSGWKRLLCEVCRLATAGKTEQELTDEGDPEGGAP